MKLVLEKPYKFGSKQSLDNDLLYIVDCIGTIEECKKMAENLQETSDDDINFAVLENRQLVNVYKGTPDEVNNSLFKTFFNFEQYYNERPVDLTIRNVSLKISRCLRIIMSFLSRTSDRKNIKNLLKSENVFYQLKYLFDFNFENINDFNKKNFTTEQIYKKIFFQIGQTMTLINGIEVYSKKGIINHYDVFEKYLMLQTEIDENSKRQLNFWKDQLCLDIKRYFNYLDITCQFVFQITNKEIKYYVNNNKNLTLIFNDNSRKYIINNNLFLKKDKMYELFFTLNYHYQQMFYDIDNESKFSLYDGNKLIGYGNVENIKILKKK